MTSVPIDPALIARLQQLGGGVPLTTPDGKPIGYFLTPEQYSAVSSALPRLTTSAVTEEDCRRALANPKRHSTEEVFRLLEGE